MQRARYRHRLERLAAVLQALVGRSRSPLPAGGFYLWFQVGDAWAFTERLAREAGALVSPGEFYGPAGADYVRAAVVQPDERIDLVAERLGDRRLIGRRRAGSSEEPWQRDREDEALRLPSASCC